MRSVCFTLPDNCIKGTFCQDLTPQQSDRDCDKKLSGGDARSRPPAFCD
ncbi:MAG: hypothetical protein SW833_11885 [Cyanobacteriota bacterium]|nr:hypothetical protein [Cyanobacteriota bacterium]